MNKQHRIAAGAIVLREDSVLLVRYHSPVCGSYLVGPGGALEADETVYETVIRETKEETGVTVRPSKVLFLEHLVCSQFFMMKVWIQCEFVEGQIRETENSLAENIVEAEWFTQSRLKNEVVFPSVVQQHSWDRYRARDWQVECLPTRVANF